jgi:hypothetical protein
MRQAASDGVDGDAFVRGIGAAGLVELRIPVPPAWCRPISRHSSSETGLPELPPSVGER